MIGWVRRLIERRRRPLPPVDAGQAARSAELAVELRLLSARLTANAAELARIHGVDRRAPHTR